MPVTTTLQCPHCGRTEQTTRIIPPGAAIRCPQCREVFNVLPSAGGLVETIPVVGDRNQGTLLETPLPGQGAGSVVPGGWEVRYAEAIRPAPAPLTPRPAPPPSQTPAKPTGPAKPLPFHRSRTMLARLLVAFLGLAVCGFIFWYVGQIKILDRTVTTATAERNAKAKAMLPEGGARPSWLPDAATATTKPASADKPEAPAATRTVAPHASTIGEMVVAIQSVRQGQISQPVAGEYLVVTLRITNLSKKPLTYASWSAPEIPVMLRVEKGAFYNRVPLPKQEEKSINPNETISDMLVFEPPPPLKALELDLPIRGSDQAHQFKIPFGVIERPLVVLAEPTKKQEKVEKSAEPVPYDPEKDEKVRADVRSQFRTNWRRIQSTSLGMETNRATRYRRTELRTLLQKIAKDHKLEVDQVKRILGLD